MSATSAFPALGTTATVCVMDEVCLGDAVTLLRAELDRLDAACSRFRDDSELARLNRAPGVPHPVSDLLYAALEVALDAARATDGILDPTIGAALVATGYDRSFARIPPEGPQVGRVAFAGAPGWRSVRLDPAGRTVCARPGIQLDLGATAKAFGADRAAAAIHEATGTATLVSLGGDIAVGGAPHGGWQVLIADDHRAPLDGPGPVIALASGGLATSSTAVRNWMRGDTRFHHLIDPRTGTSAESAWRTVSVAARTCVSANTASSTALILDASAPAWLAERGLAARLVAHDGTCTYVGGWPEDAR